MSARSKGAFAAMIASGACVLACGAIIGTRDLTLTEAADGGATSTDGSVASDSPVTSGDANGSGDDGSTDGGGDDGGCPGVTGSLQTDPNNCGVCHHSCLGGDCKAGACQPVAIATGQDGAYAVAVDSTTVYWVSYTGNTASKSAKDGTGLTQLVNNYADSPFDIALDDTYVYIANVGGSVVRCAKAGCGGSATPLESGFSTTGVAVDDTHVYWAEYGNYDIGRMNKDGGGAKGYLQTNMERAPHMITVDDASVFFTTDDLVGRMPKDAATVPTSDVDAAVGFTTIASTSIVAFGVAVDDTTLFWVENDDPGRIAYAPKNGSGPVSTLAGTQHYPLRVVLDAANVYWVAYGPDTSADPNATLFLNGYVATCPKTGCAAGVKILAGGLKDARGIAVDDEAVYFTVGGNLAGEGGVYKIAK